MERLRNKIALNSNSEIVKEQITLPGELQAVKNSATTHGIFESVDYHATIIDTVQKSYRTIWEIILDTTDNYFKKNIFEALGSDEIEVTNEIRTIAEQPRNYCEQCFDQFSNSANAKNALRQILTTIEEQSITASFRRTQQLFNAARGIE